MIKLIIKLTVRPFQTFFDTLRHERGKRKMMAYVLKIGHEFNQQAGLASKYNGV